MLGGPAILIIILAIYIFSSIKIITEYERGVIFRLGHVLPNPKGPGVVLVFAPFDRIVRISLRVDTIEVPPQDVITRDNVTVKVNAVIYFRVIDPRLAVIEVSNFLYATSQLAQTTLRSVLGEVELDQLLSQRESLNVRLQSILDQHTSPWGVKVTMVEVKQVDIAEQMIRAIARQAEAERTRRAVAAIARAKKTRAGRGLIFAPHISGAPHEILASAEAALEAGATGLMFSESFAGGVVRMVREATRHLPNPPAIYGHNAGIGVKTRSINREVIDLLARLDGIDFRQTSPVKPGPPFLLPYGQEWEASEEILARPLPGIKTVMIVRAGALDQGNIGLNLADAERRGLTDKILFLAGSAINSIKNVQGKADPRLGAEAMMQALEVHRAGELRDVPVNKHLSALATLARRQKLKALLEALRQRYPKLSA